MAFDLKVGDYISVPEQGRYSLISYRDMLSPRVGDSIPRYLLVKEVVWACEGSVVWLRFENYRYAYWGVPRYVIKIDEEEVAMYVLSQL